MACRILAECQAGPEWRRWGGEGCRVVGGGRKASGGDKKEDRFGWVEAAVAQWERGRDQTSGRLSNEHARALDLFQRQRANAKVNLPHVAFQPYLNHIPVSAAAPSFPAQRWVHAAEDIGADHHLPLWLQYRLGFNPPTIQMSSLTSQPSSPNPRLPSPHTR